jgi:hypothetical protein
LQNSANVGTTHSVRTEVTVQRAVTTLRVSGSVDGNVCPLCGQALNPAQAERASHRLQEGLTTDIATNEFPHADNIIPYRKTGDA